MDRSKFYTLDYSGFAYYNISRAYNDLKCNEHLINSLYKVNKPFYNNLFLYSFKIGMSNLKETLKLLAKIKKSSNYSEFYKNIIKNEEIRKLYIELADELEKTEDKPNSINAKYLSMRNDVFHYCTEPDDFDFYKSTTETLIKKNIHINIHENKKGNYDYEYGIDLPLVYGNFGEDQFVEVKNLRKKVIILLKLILNNYYKSLS